MNLNPAETTETTETSTIDAATDAATDVATDATTDAAKRSWRLVVAITVDLPKDILGLGLLSSYLGD